MALVLIVFLACRPPGEPTLEHQLYLVVGQAIHHPKKSGSEPIPTVELVDVFTAAPG